MGLDVENTQIRLLNAGSALEVRDYHAGALCSITGSSPNPVTATIRRHHGAASIDTTSPACAVGVLKDAAADADPVAYLNANGESDLGGWVTTQGASFRDDEFIPAIQKWA